MPTYKGRKCQFDENHIKNIDYKNINLLRKYVTKYYKIVPRYYSGTCIKHQKKLATAIKKARYMALLPYIAQ